MLTDEQVVAYGYQIKDQYRNGEHWYDPATGENTSAWYHYLAGDTMLNLSRHVTVKLLLEFMHNVAHGVFDGLHNPVCIKVYEYHMRHIRGDSP